jgi:phenylacetate-CoA ligase
LRGEVWARATNQRGFSWAGFDLDRDRTLNLFGRGAPYRCLGRQLARHCGGLTLMLSRDRLRLTLPAYDIQPEHIHDYYMAIERFAPHFLRAYGGTAFLLAQEFGSAGYPNISFRGVFTTSELLLPHQRSYIEKAFRTTVFDYYGCSEINSLGFECDRHDGYHIPEEHAVIETMADPEEHAAGLGGGAFLVTDLDNYCMPLIRYRNGDAGILSDEPCHCGRTLRRISRLYGRTADMLRSTSGNLVDGTLIASVFNSKSGIREFCFTQETDRRCRLQYIPDEADRRLDQIPTRSLEQQLLYCRQHLGHDMEIVTEQVDRIPLAGSNKRRYIRSLLNHRQSTAPGIMPS